MASPLRTAVLVPVPEASGVVDRWREQTCRDKPSTGVPAHITLIFPFAPAARVDDDLISSLRDVVAGIEAFEFALRRMARFPDTLYLAPEPASNFVALTEAVVQGFPEYPPYDGAFTEIVPHLTVAHGDVAGMDAAEADVGTHLPIKGLALEAVLLEEHEPDWGRWDVRARLPLNRATRTRR